jgi:hypothetical protein
MATQWMNLVKNVYNKNKSKKGYKLAHAMKTAKNLYKKGGDCGLRNIGGKKSKNANKSRKSRKN